MAMRKRLVLAVGLVVCLGLVGLVIVPQLEPPKPGVTVENFRRLHQGMTFEEVGAILDAPGQGRTWWGEGQSLTVYWKTDHGHAEVEFIDPGEGGAQAGQFRADDGRVVLLRPKPLSFWDQLRRRLPW
jgi:hypothetical protein